MADLELTEINKAGVQHLENWLHENGYNEVEQIFLQATSADIKANGAAENILVQVRTTLYKEEHVLLSGTDRFALKELAMRLERVPYAAYLIIAADKSLMGEINWERLT